MLGYCLGRQLTEPSALERQCISSEAVWHWQHGRALPTQAVLNCLRPLWCERSVLPLGSASDLTTTAQSRAPRQLEFLSVSSRLPGVSAHVLHGIKIVSPHP